MSCCRLLRRQRLIDPSATSAQVTRRSLLTLPITEPPLNNSIPEKPYTIILTEDAGLYPESWHEQLSTKLPTEHGIPYTNFSLTSTTDTDATDSTKSSQRTLFHEGLDEMKQELSTEHLGTTGGILVARGPWMSWMAQFHLESMPLAGLVLVDPLPLDDRNSLNQLELLYQSSSGNMTDSLEYLMYQNYKKHFDDNWSAAALQLEPGVVPLLILQSIRRPAFDKAAVKTAARHENLKGPFGKVPIYKLDSKSEDPAHTDIAAILTSWVVHHVNTK
jgi:hypothetical protein